MVDYSKWDALDVCADGDDDYAARRRGAPRVTRLEGPSRVTFGGPNLDRDAIVAEVRAPDPDARPPPDPPRRSSAIDYARFDRVAADVSSSDDEREYFEDDAWALKHGLRAPPSASDASKAVVGPRREYVGAMPPPSEPPPGYFPKTRGIGEPSPPPIGNARTVRLTGTTPATAAANAMAMANAQPANAANAANAAGSSGDDATTAASKAASAFAARKEKFTLNGGEERESESSGGRYVWCQDEREATISAFAPAGAKAKDVVVKCTPTKISVTHMGHTLLDDEFAHPIDPEHRDRDDEINGHLDDYDACDNFEFGDWELCGASRPLPARPRSRVARRFLRTSFLSRAVNLTF